MKRLLIILALALTALGCAGEPTETEPTFEMMKAAAAERGVPLLIDFWKDG